MERLTTTRYRGYQGGYFQTLIAPEQTGDALALLELTLPKGAEPPPHIHTREDEAFYVLDGEISVTVGERVSLLKRGDALFAPRNVPHSFKILTEQATLMNLITPGNLWNYFIEFSEPLPEMPAAVAAPGAPPVAQMKAMLDVITNVYNVNFL
ncbi:cupin domain-containing protein [Niabella drilacis]|uniref:Cupin domain-containing protein n=1 Tax=Niabella drilacis (strain DSM 25811 / CCM 8410 / CCUG 62505 / LMG 26954 / E90) TaxID=1285928 RepID=A0A1G6Y041_NIADE|nr:cupin domain-containing protein [Niabella drilacis]SDD83662.1 Cupin domain-containing protein [Niabella drilacis]